MKKGIAILVCLFLMGCAPDCPDCDTPVIQEEVRKEIPKEFIENQVQEIARMKKDGKYVSQKLYRAVDHEAGVVCWYILGTQSSIGLGCLPVEQTRLFEK